MDEADDQLPAGVWTRPSDSLAEGAFTWPVSLRHRLIDDHHFRIACDVAGVECATFKNSNAIGIKVICCHRLEEDFRPLTRLRLWRAFDLETSAAVESPNRQRIRKRHLANAGQRGDSFFNLLIESKPLLRGRVVGSLSAHLAVSNPSTFHPGSRLVKRSNPLRNNPPPASRTNAKATSPTTNALRNRLCERLAVDPRTFCFRAWVQTVRDPSHAGTVPNRKPVTTEDNKAKPNT